MAKRRSAAGARQLSVSLPADLIGRLHQIAEAQGMSVSAVARVAITEGMTEVAGAIQRARRMARRATEATEAPEAWDPWNHGGRP